MTCTMTKNCMPATADRASALRACAALNTAYFTFVRFFAGAFYFAYYYFTTDNFTPRTRPER